MSEVRPPAPHAPWHAEALWRQLQPVLPGVAVEVLARVESTNTELLDRLRGGHLDPGEPARSQGRRLADLQPVLLVAEQQTHGRGRQGRDWRAVPGASLTFSLALPLPAAGPGGASGLSLAVGCALADALEPPSAAAPRLLLKWPNDLWLRDDGMPGGGRKLGGILIETTTIGAHRAAVIGVGLNVRAQPAEGLTHGLASLDELDAAVDPPAVLHRVALPLVQALRRFEVEGLAPFIDPYARRDLLAGRALRAVGATVLEGTGLGIDAGGALRLQRADGEVITVTSGEVSVRPC